MSNIDLSNSIIEKEIVESFSTYRTQFTISVQAYTVIILANVSLIGFGITSGNTNIFYLASFCPILILFVRVRTVQFMLPIIYSAYFLERKLNQKNIDLLAMTYIAIKLPHYQKRFDKILMIESHEERMSELKKINKWYNCLFASKSSSLLTVFFIFSSILEMMLPKLI